MRPAFEILTVEKGTEQSTTQQLETTTFVAHALMDLLSTGNSPHRTVYHIGR
jgi:hypothetical protein